MGKYFASLCICVATNIFYFPPVQALEDPWGGQESQSVSQGRIEIYSAAKSREIVRKAVKPKDFPYDLIISDGLERQKKTWFPWDPTGANTYPTSAACTQDVLRDLLWRNKSAAAQGEAVNAWVERCNDEISRPGSRRSVLPVIKYLTVRYNFADNPHIRVVKAILPGGKILTGFIALKPDNIPRPLVIAKCGVLCNAEQSTTHKSFMMHLFDESPFHVMALANVTGSEFQVNNGAFSLGGFDEGRQLYKIAQLIQTPGSPVANRISSVHALGHSLGGHAALFAGVYASANDSPGRESLQSVAAVCPVVVVENSVKRLYTVRPLATLATFETLNQLRTIFSSVPILRRLFPSNWRSLRGRRLMEKISEATFHYYRDYTAAKPWDLKPFQGERVTSLQQFWNLNDYRNYYQRVRIPTITIAAENDDLVRVTGNSRLLSAALLKDPNKNIGTVYFKQGNHCALGVANGWANYSMLMREYVLSHSPEASLHWKSRSVRVPNLYLRAKERIAHAVWRASLGQKLLELKLVVVHPQEGTRRELYSQVPVKTLPLEISDFPRTEFEAKTLTRFANTRVSLVSGAETRNGTVPVYAKVWNWQ